MTYIIKFREWVLNKIKPDSNTNDKPVIIPREITPIDLRFEDVK